MRTTRCLCRGQGPTLGGFALAVVSLAALFVPLTASAQSGNTWDLKQDWSDAANPNGPWAYREGNNALPAIPLGGWQPGNGWSSPQPGWAESATGNNRIPFWFRSNGTETFSPDTLAGDIVVHSQDDFSGVGNGVANVTWTSPIAGTISIIGGAWIARDIGRSNDWKIYKNAALLSSGAVSSGDAYNRANPFSFAAGSGGAAAVQNITVALGDVIKLEIVRTSSAGDFVGINLKIVAGYVWNSGPGANGHTYIPVLALAGITWQQAENAAVAAGGHLASIESADENAFVYSTVSGTSSYWFTNGSGQAIGPWLGGYQVQVGPEPAGGWQWVGGNGFSYTNWAASQPDNANSGADDRTIFFHPTAATGDVWNDYPAEPASLDRPKGYIIEIGPSSGSSTVWNTGTGANGHSYEAVLVTGGITWAEAEAAAVARGGHLASITSIQESAFVFALVSGRPEFWFNNTGGAGIGPWFGGYQPDGSSEPAGGWQWSDGSAFSYTNWASGEPNNFNNENRLSFYASPPGGGIDSKWNDLQPSGVTLGYIIEWPGVAGAPTGPQYADMLYIESQPNNAVYQYRIDATNPPMLVRTLTDNMNKPSGFALAADHELFVVQRGDYGAGNAKLSRYLSADDVPAANGFLTPTSPTLDFAHGAAFRGNDLLVVDCGHNTVRRFQSGSGGSFTEQLPAIAPPASDTLLRYVAVNPSTQEVFVSHAGSNNKIYRYLISSGGAITTNGQITGNGLSSPHGMVFSSWGEMFVANYDGNSISRFLFDSGGAAVPNGTIGGNGMSNPVGIAFSPWGELFVGNTSGQTISRFTFSAAGVATANGTITTPGQVGTLQFVSASAPEVPAPCVPGVTTNVTDGLIGWWKGDGDATDYTGNNNGTEENGVTYEAGRFGQAFRVGGTGQQRVNLGFLPQLKGAAAYTLSAWIKADVPGIYATLCLPVGNIANPPGSTLNNARGFYIGNSSGYLNPAFIAISNPLQYGPSDAFPNPPGGTWKHIAGVWRSSDGFYALYIDGVPEATGNATPGVKYPDGSADLAPAYIGRWSWCSGSTVSWQGSLSCLFDDVRIYTRDLTPEEIALIASGDDFNTCPPLNTGIPPLTAARVPAGVRVSWPSQYTGWSLETSTDLINWTPVTGTPAIEASEFALTTSAAPVRQFFRLRRNGS